jgi:hypothetical protein
MLPKLTRIISIALTCRFLLTLVMTSTTNQTAV